MDLLILGAKSALAMMLLIAGPAKLADLASFTATMRMFAPGLVPLPVVRAAALAIAVAEATLGVISVATPGAHWVNAVIFVLACAFLAVSAAGNVAFRGRSCRCFGPLSQRKFDAWGIARTTAIAAGAAVAMIGVRPAAVDIPVTARLALLAMGLLVALASFTAAKALSVTHRTESRLTAP